MLLLTSSSKLNYYNNSQVNCSSAFHVNFEKIFSQVGNLSMHFQSQYDENVYPCTQFFYKNSFYKNP